jgi:hypothetical protein
MRAIPTAVCLVLLLLPTAALAGGGKGKGAPEREARAALAIDIDVVITSEEAAVIRDYFRVKPYAPQALPPGIAKNVKRGKPLPPGIAKKALPADLVYRLPRRDGYELVIVGSDIVRVAVATGIIVDVLKDVF